MADESNSNLSEVETRRLRRRQRILENQGARMNRILGENNSNKSTFTSEAVEATEEVASGFGSTTSFLASKKGSRNESSPSVFSEESSGNLPELLRELSRDIGGTSESDPVLSSPSSSEQRKEIKMGVQSDGSVILPKIPHNYGRIILCVLALFLSLMNAKQFAVTFISWEVAYYFLNGLPPYPPANSIVVALALFGLRESQLMVIKKVMHMMECAFLDFAIFLTCVMLPHIVRNLIQQLKNQEEALAS